MLGHGLLVQLLLLRLLLRRGLPLLLLLRPLLRCGLPLLLLLRPLLRRGLTLLLLRSFRRSSLRHIRSGRGRSSHVQRLILLLHNGVPWLVAVVLALKQYLLLLRSRIFIP